MAKHPKRPALKRWHFSFCEWEYEQPGRTTKAAQIAEASRLAGEAISYRQIEWLRKNPAYIEYREQILSGGIEAARAKLIAGMGRIVDLHFWGAERSREKDDTRGLAKYTAGSLDKVLPSREASVLQPVNVTINFSERQLRLLDSEKPVIEAEAIPSLSSEDDQSLPESPDLPALPPGCMTLGDALAIRRENDKPKPSV